MKIKHILLAFTLVLSTQLITAQETTENIMKAAQETAKKEGKNVFIMFHASWCTWCKKMDNNMMSKATKELFEEYYVIEHLVVKESKKNKNLENPGALELLKKYKGENSGIPFWLIFDSDGRLLTDSYDVKGNNLGCPASPKEVEQFVEKLKLTSELTDNQLKIITEQFVIKK
ncbi:thioredoxin family protein [uncultured Lacinutrix sp.]|uniref:thioredoxin family protein n=1 Tax=uncultured Lacinutrix sp. TaxID=574032 RepID=UPI002632BED6|nr:thioredoxin family protein [uncultured Lacinutrix sp.]